MNNSIHNIRPDLALEWHPTKNGILKPENLAVNSHKKVWWQCRKNPYHEWLSPPTNRNRSY